MHLFFPSYSPVKGVKLDPKIGLYFTHRNGPVFRAKTDLSDLECAFSSLNVNTRIVFFITLLLLLLLLLNSSPV